MYIQRFMYIHGIYVVYTDYIPHRGSRWYSTALPTSITVSQSESESLSQRAQLEEHNLPDPAMSNSANYVYRACQCYQRGPGFRSSSYFCSYKAVTTHIGRSTVCQTEGKGFYTVPVQYKPSGRAEDQEAGVCRTRGSLRGMASTSCRACRNPRQAY